MRKRIIAVLLAFAVIAGTLVATQTAAAASSGSLPGCGSNRVCLYEHIDGGGARIDFVTYSTCIYVGAWFNDKTSSWQNNTFNRVTVYQNADCTGFTDELPMGYHRHSMGSFFMNDVVSAVWIGSNAP